MDTHAADGTSANNSDNPTLPARCASYNLTHLSNSELLAGTRRLIGRSNQLLAELLAHLAEVETRGIYRIRACSTLTAYCVYELRLSEDAASRRVTGARLVKRFPVLLDAVASGELHLTGLLLLGPHLTEENHLEALARAKHRTKKEIEKLVRVLDPLPDVSARIEPLGPELAVTPRNPSWQEFVSAMCPIRQLAPGERPRDWLEDEGAAEDLTRPCKTLVSASAREPAPAGESAPARIEPANQQEADREEAGRSCSAPARKDLTLAAGPQRYHVQFMAGQEYVELVEQAKALLSHALPKGDLAEIQLRAMRALVAELEKRKYAVAPCQEQTPGASDQAAPSATPEPRDASPTTEPRESDVSAATQPRDAIDPQDLTRDDLEPRSRRWRGRYIPAAVRRAVRKRDGDRCTYVDPRGQRCRETHYLEFDHLEPFARGGAHTARNLALRCRAHNALAAEEDFGRELMKRNQALRR